MVYCGKPSKGCSNCRDRKIRCDQKEPGCGQCVKREQQCPGYRNLVDLMFRDESSHVIKKAKAKARRGKGGATFVVTSPEPVSSPLPSSRSDRAKSASRTPEPRSASAFAPPSSSKPLSLLTPSSSIQGDAYGREIVWALDDSYYDNLLPSPEEPTWPSTPLISFHYSLSPTYQERGTAYFFSQHVTIDEVACHSRFDFVYEVWKPVSMLPERQVDGVMASMTAVGLAGLANMTRSAEMAESARKSYGTALQLTNAALRNPVQAVKDTTMLSVLILSLYEMSNGFTPQTQAAWRGHIDGAAALAKMRGTGQFATNAGVKMFLMLCQNVMINCMQRELPMPPKLVQLREELDKLLMSMPNGGGGMPLVNQPIYQLMQIRHDIKHGLVKDRAEVVDRLLAIDAAFAAAVDLIPPMWQFKTVHVSRPNSAVFKGSCHVYPNLYIAGIWNGVRACRLLIHETVVDEITRGRMEEAAEREAERPGSASDEGGAVAAGWARFSSGLRWETELQRSTTMLEKLRDAVLNTIPQHFGLVRQRQSDAMDESPVIASVANVKVKELPKGSPSASGPQSPPHSTRSNPSSPGADRRSSSPDGAGASPLQRATSPKGTESVQAANSQSSMSVGTGPKTTATQSTARVASPPPLSVGATPSHEPPSRGPTIIDPTLSRSQEEAAERFMVLASTCSTVVFPLYLVGMSSVCTPSVKAYVLERLDAVWRETGHPQAQYVAALVEENRALVPDAIEGVGEGIAEDSVVVGGDRSWTIGDMGRCAEEWDDGGMGLIDPQLRWMVDGKDYLNVVV